MLDLGRFIDGYDLNSIAQLAIKGSSMFAEIWGRKEREGKNLHIFVDIVGQTCDVRPATGIVHQGNPETRTAIGNFVDLPSHWAKKDIWADHIEWTHPRPELAKGIWAGKTTPVVVGDEVYLSTGIDGFVVLDLQTGRERWRGDGTAQRDTQLLLIRRLSRRKRWSCYLRPRKQRTN